MTRLSELLARCEFVAEVSAAQLEMQSPSADVDRSPRNHGEELLRKHLRQLERLGDDVERDLLRMQISATERGQRNADILVTLAKLEGPRLAVEVARAYDVEGRRLLTGYAVMKQLAALVEDGMVAHDRVTPRHYWLTARGLEFVRGL